MRENDPFFGFYFFLSLVFLMLSLKPCQVLPDSWVRFPFQTPHGLVPGARGSGRRLRAEAEALESTAAPERWVEAWQVERQAGRQWKELLRSIR